MRRADAEKERGYDVQWVEDVENLMDQRRSKAFHD